MSSMVVVETYSGEKLVGAICEPTEQLFKRLFAELRITAGMLSEGIWLKRQKHISFVGHSEIKSMRAATLFDRE